jgi:hypothetical protein
MTTERSTTSAAKRAMGAARTLLTLCALGLGASACAMQPNAPSDRHPFDEGDKGTSPPGYDGTGDTSDWSNNPPKNGFHGYSDQSQSICPPGSSPSTTVRGHQPPRGTETSGNHGATGGSHGSKRDYDLPAGVLM